MKTFSLSKNFNSTAWLERPDHANDLTKLETSPINFNEEILLSIIGFQGN